MTCKETPRDQDAPTRREKSQNNLQHVLDYLYRFYGNKRLQVKFHGFLMGLLHLEVLTLLSFHTHPFCNTGGKMNCASGMERKNSLCLWAPGLIPATAELSLSLFQMSIRKLFRLLLPNTKRGRWQCLCLPNAGPWLCRPPWMPTHLQVSGSRTVLHLFCVVCMS